MLLKEKQLKTSVRNGCNTDTEKEKSIQGTLIRRSWNNLSCLLHGEDSELDKGIQLGGRPAAADINRKGDKQDSHQ